MSGPQETQEQFLARLRSNAAALDGVGIAAGAEVLREAADELEAAWKALDDHESEAQNAAWDRDLVT